MPKSLREKIYYSLRDKIIYGELKPGMRLTEADLVSSLKTSKTPIREALRQLESDGLIEFSSYKGATVTGGSISEIEKIYDILCLLEALAVTKATPKINEKDMAKLIDVNKEMQKAKVLKNPRAYVDLNSKFHAIFCDKCGNEILGQIIRNLVRKVLRYRIIISSIPGTQKQYIVQHEEILKAVKQKKAAEAGKIMKKHINIAKTILIEHMKKMAFV